MEIEWEICGSLSTVSKRGRAWIECCGRFFDSLSRRFLAGTDVSQAVGCWLVDGLQVKWLA
jgi:hypothetical protein